ncbi:MAG: YceI family protein [Burkholderiales bacterium]|jgi:polyisoprenoid-binding protein YceI|nr:YceI family protein [Burkholderiales bacterium]
MIPALGRISLALLFAMGSASPVFAQTAYTRVLPASKVDFSATQMGVAMHGHFKTLMAAVDFLPTDLAKSHVSVVINAASVDAGSGQTDDLLTGSDWLDAKAYPQDRFTSTGFTPAGPGKFWLTGQFTVKGKTQPLRVLVTTHPAGANLVMDADFQINRMAFGLGTGSWADTGVVAAALPIHVHLVVAPQG